MAQSRTQRNVTAKEAVESLAKAFTKYSFIQIGVVTHVDYERGLISINFTDGVGSQENIPLSQPAAGAGYIAYMPVIGDYVVCGYRRKTELQGQIVILNYIPASTLLQKDFGRGLFGRYHTIKLYPGEVGISSAQGSLIHLTKGVRITDSSLREFGINPFTGVFFSDTDGQDVRSGNVNIRTGIVLREGVQDSTLFSDVEFPLSSDGEVLPVITKDNIPLSSIELDSPDGFRPVFNEYRIEIIDGTDLTRSPFGFTKEFEPPVAELVLGNAIGNTPDTELYGKPFRLQVFGPSESLALQPRDVSLSNSNLKDETSTIAPMYFLRAPLSGRGTYPTAIAIDKEGQYFAHIAASKTHPNGQGNSAEIATEGRVRLFVGKNGAGLSLQTKFSGGVQSVLGATTESKRSIDIDAYGAAYMKFRSDTQGVARYVEVIGDDVEVIHGTKVQNYRAPYRVTYPSKQESVNGSASHIYSGASQYTYGSNLDKVVGGTESSNIVKGRTTVIVSAADSGYADKLQVLQGNVHEEILVGSKTIQMSLGDFTETLVTGSRKISVTTGNIEMNTIAGNLSLSTAAGNVDIQALAGAVNITAGTSFNVTAGVSAQIQAPTVGIGAAPNPSMGIITFLSHRDYITGAPLVPALTAFAGP